MDADESPGHDPIQSTGQDEPVSVANSVVQVRGLLEQFAVRCDDEMLRLKYEFLKVRPRVSRLTLGLAVVVISITSLSSYLLITNGATTGQFLLSAIGEMFLFGLVVASGLTDLLWRDPTRVLFAKDDTLAKISGINEQLANLAALREEWERDVHWHRQRGGEAREELATCKLQIADAESLLENKVSEIDAIVVQQVEAEKSLEQAREELAEEHQRREALRTELVELESKHSDLGEQVSEQDRVLADLTSRVHESTTAITDAEDRIRVVQGEHERLLQENEELKETLVQNESRNEQLEIDIAQLQERLLQGTDNATHAEKRLQQLTSDVNEREAALYEIRSAVEESERIHQTLLDEIGKQESAFELGRCKLNELQEAIAQNENAFGLLSEKVDIVEANCQLLEDKLEEYEAISLVKQEFRDGVEAELEQLHEKSLLAEERIAGQESAIELAECKVNELAIRVELDTVSAAEKAERLRQLEESVEEKTGDLGKITLELSQTNERWDHASKILFGMEYEISDRQQITDALIGQLQMLENELVAAEQRRFSLAVAADESVTKLNSLESEISERESNLVEIEQKLELATQLKSDVVGELGELNLQISEIRASFASEIEDRNVSLIDLDQSVESHVLREAELRQALADGDAILEQNRLQLSQFDQQIEERQEFLSRLERDIDDGQKREQQQANQLQMLRGEVATVTDEVALLFEGQRRQAEQLESTLDGLKSQVSENIKRRETLELEIDGLAQNRDMVIREVAGGQQQLEETRNQLAELDLAVVKVGDELTGVSEGLECGRAEQRAIEARINILRGQLEALVAEVSPVIERQAAEVDSQNTTLEEILDQISRKNLELEEFASTIQEMEDSKRLLEDELTELVDNVASKKQLAEEIEATIAQSQRAAESLEDEVSAALKNREELQEQIHSISLSLEAAEAEFLTKTREIEDRQCVLDHELKHLNESVSEREALRSRLDLEIRNLRDLLRTDDANLVDLRREIESRQNELEEILNQNTKRLAEHEEVSKQLAELEFGKREEVGLLAEELDTQKLKLEEIRIAVQAFEQQSNEKQAYAKSLDTEIATASRSLENLTVQNEKLTQVIGLLDDQSSELESRIAEQKVTLADLLSDTDAENSSLEAIREKAEEERKQLQAECLALAEERARYVDGCELLKNQLENAKDDVLGLQGSRDDLNAEITGLKEMIQNEKENEAALVAKIEQQQRKLAELENLTAEKEELAVVAEQRVSDAERAYLEAELRITKLQDEADRQGNSVAEVREKLDGLESERAAANEVLSDLTKEISDIRERRDGLTGECRELSNRLESLRAEVLEADQLSSQWKAYLAEIEAAREAADVRRNELNEEMVVLERECESKRRELADAESVFEAAGKERAERLTGLEDKIRELESSLSRSASEKEVAEAEQNALRQETEQRKIDLKSVEGSLAEMRAKQAVLEEKARAAIESAAKAMDESQATETSLGRVESLVEELDQQLMLDQPQSSIPKSIEGEIRRSKDAWDDVLS